MQPHPRITKTVKWGGAALTVLLLAAWIASGWWTFGWLNRAAAGVSFYRGHTVIAFQNVPPSPELSNSPGWVLQRRNEAFRWWFMGGRANFGWVFFIPTWSLAAATLLITALAWRLDRLAWYKDHPHICTKCHYDRTGLAVGVPCPECGTMSVL